MLFHVLAFIICYQMSLLACSHFRPNLWKPTSCAYCYRPKDKHCSRDNELATEWKSRRCTNDVSLIIPRAATISTHSPIIRRERNLYSEPPGELTDNADEDIHCIQFMDDTQKQIGIVKPYAVVELTSLDWSEQNQEYHSNFSNTLPLNMTPIPNILKQQVGPCTNISYSTSPSTPPVPKKNIIPKRKAPPPPKESRRATRSSSVPTIVACNVTEPTPSITTPIETASTKPNSPLVWDKGPAHSENKIPPNKPPRTKSTFMLNDEEQKEKVPPAVTPAIVPAVNPAIVPAVTPAIVPAVVQPQSMVVQPSSDYEPLRRINHSSSMVDNQPSLSLIQQIQEVFNNAITNITDKCFHELTLTDEFKDMDWGDITVCIDMNNHHQLYYHMQPITLEPLIESKHSHLLNIARIAAPHLNLLLIRGTLMQTPADHLDFLPDANQFIVNDSTPGKVPLEKILPKWRSSLSEEKYIQRILLVLVQVLKALKHLYYNGIVHRDVGLDSLIGWIHGSDCIVKLTNFQYALHRQGPISATTFVYAYHELAWLGGVESHLPPEILDTPNNANTLDFSHTDTFAVGCLIYELIVGISPFDKNTNLVYTPYTEKDLTGFSKHSRILVYLEKLAHLLLIREPSKRLAVSDALLLVQSLLWLPHSWLERSVAKDVMQDHITYLKATLLSDLAQHDNRDPILLETLLKADFLKSCNSSDLVCVLAVFNKSNTTVYN